MKIAQFKEFKEEYVYPGIVEEHFLLEKVKNNTFLLAATVTCNSIQKGLLNSKRPKHDTDSTILLAYIIYVCTFTSSLFRNFDKVCLWLVDDPYTYVNEITIKEALEK